MIGWLVLVTALETTALVGLLVPGDLVVLLAASTVDSPARFALVRMPLRLFATWAGLGALVWALVYTSVGTAAGAAYRQYGHLGLLTSVAVGAVTVTVLVVRARRRARLAAVEETCKIPLTGERGLHETDPALR